MSLAVLTEHWDEALAVGVGIVVTNVVGDTVSGWISKWVPAKWLDPVTELLIGVGILFVGEWAAPIAWRAYARLAAFGAIGLGVADAVSIAFGLKASSSVGSSSSSGGQGSSSEGGGSHVGFI